MLLTNAQQDRLSRKTGYPIDYHDGQYWITIGEKELFLMPWRQITRLKNMRGKIQDGTVSNAVAMKAECVVQRCHPIEAVTVREMDIAEWVLGDSFTSIFALTDNERVMHLIGRMKSNARVTLDLTNGLNEMTRETERHEVIAADGDLCDLPVGMQFASEDIYAFRSDAKEPETFMEVIIEDEFYTREEAQVLRDAMTVIASEEEQAYRVKRFEKLRKMVETAKYSSERRQRVEVEDENC